MLGGKWCHPNLSTLAQGSQPPLFRQPSQNSEGSQLALCHNSLVFSLACDWDLKPQILKSLAQHSTSPLLQSRASLLLMKGTSRVFCPWGGNKPSPKSTPARGMFFPSMFLRLLSQAIYSEDRSLLPRSACHSSSPEKITHFQKPQSLSSKSYLQKKNWDTQYFSLPSPWSRDIFLLC